ncbi:MAG: folylpolyglutamate synthase/dihydrofolate synthase family protein [Actinomycetota bacterium]
MNFDEALAALNRRTNYERTGRLVDPSLERMRALMDLMADPQRSFPAIHITGTNGKTTVARAATEVLRAAGLHVATYTSPHVESVCERFQYDGEPIPEDAFVEVWCELAPYLDHLDGRGMELTWFEAATALAFTWFADKGVDVGVIEVGMGGTWDATNVVDAPVAVITRVDLDHPELGATPVEIAREKAGIIKPGAVLFSATQEADVAEVIRARCADVDAVIRSEGIAFEVERSVLALGGQQISARIERDRYTDVFLPMFGEHFAHDVVLGAAAARAFMGEAALEPTILAEAFGRVRVPGRLEAVRRSPLVVLDGAHNPAAAAALAAALPTAFRYEQLVLVISAMGDKDLHGILEPLIPLAAQVIVTRNESPRAAEPVRLAEAARALGADPVSVTNVSDAISVAIERVEDRDCVLVTGSLYTVGEARRALAR